MNLNSLKKIKGNKRKRLRIGRGTSTGFGGHTVGKGMKGQNSRSGSSLPFGFEGGQVPLYKKLPKIGGFRNPTRKHIVGVGIGRLNCFKADTEVVPADLVEKKIIKKLPKHGVKLVATGELTKKLNLKGFLASKGATVQIEKLGGKLN